jgi:hypothetical protein
MPSTAATNAIDSVARLAQVVCGASRAWIASSSGFDDGELGARLIGLAEGEEAFGIVGHAQQPARFWLPSSGYHLTKDSHLWFRAVLFCATLRDAQRNMYCSDAG